MNKQPLHSVKPHEFEALVETLKKFQSVVHRIVTCSDRELKEIDNEFQRLVAKFNSYRPNQYPE